MCQAGAFNPLSRENRWGLLTGLPVGGSIGSPQWVKKHPQEAIAANVVIGSVLTGGLAGGAFGGAAAAGEGAAAAGAGAAAEGGAGMTAAEYASALAAADAAGGAGGAASGAAGMTAADYAAAQAAASTIPEIGAAATSAGGTAGGTAGMFGPTAAGQGLLDTAAAPATSSLGDIVAAQSATPTAETSISSPLKGLLDSAKEAGQSKYANAARDGMKYYNTYNKVSGLLNPQQPTAAPRASAPRSAGTYQAGPALYGGKMDTSKLTPELQAKLSSMPPEQLQQLLALLQAQGG